MQIPPEHIERIDALMGPRRRGLFFRKAIERELLRMEAIVRKADRDALKAASED